MQNKGLVRLFAVLFGLVSIYQLSFTFMASKIEDEATAQAADIIPTSEKDYATKRDKEVARYLDSIGNEKVWLGQTYNDVKDQELNKGLDLKGGINATLQIKVKDILKGLANNTKNPAFNKALEMADEASKNSQDDYVELFFNAFDEVKGEYKLANPDIFANKSLSDKVNFQMEEEAVKDVIRKEIDNTVVSAFEVLRKRIDKFGVTQPNIQRLGTSGRILVALPGAKDIERIKNLLQSTAQLEFWETYRPQDLNAFLLSANNELKTILEAKEATKDTVSSPTSELDSLLTDAAQDSLEVNQKNPLFDLLAGAGRGNAIAAVAIKDTAKVNEYLAMSQIKRLIPNNIQYVRFVWSRPTANAELIDLHALKGNRENKARISGDVIDDARDTFDQMSRPAVTMSMNSRGSKEWEKLTGDAFTNQTSIAVVLDNLVYTAPGVSSGPIAGGRSEITGDFSINETKDIANVLRAGKLPASAELIAYDIVGPSLGQEAIDSGFMSFLIAMLVVLVWMVFYYGRAGLFADIALVFNVLLIFGVLASLKAVLTLPGIAGIVLTIGMSVDANVLIFERIKEELAKGKGQKSAIADGFKNALSSILDANITTGLTAIILMIFGTGPIQGFATTLLIGIMTSLFTAIFVTRLFVDGYVSKSGRVLAFATSLTKGWFTNMKIAFLSKRKIAYMVSGVVLAVCVFSLFTKGLEEGVDFSGGRNYKVRFENPVNATEIAETLNESLEAPLVKRVGAENQVQITTNYKVDVEGTEVDDEIQQKLYEGLTELLPDGMTYQEFLPGESDKQFGILQSIKVGPTIADDIKKNAFWAVLGSLAVVFLYILMRFRKWQFSLGAVAAVFHDVLIVLGVFSLTSSIMPFNMEIDQAFIAAILTVIGYSLNDTVVVFDRIREIVGLDNWKGGTNVDLALNSTLSRTLNTSLTTLVVLLSIFIFGGDTLRGFMFAMIVGVIVGTYSSLFIATPVMFDTLKDNGKSEK
ncbi:MAG: protein translocase subunit SecDF [Flavobacteriaceae bacterium]|nr:protein translocase subunit SecDF [Flavobacteriaceae bacterium]